MDSKLDSFICFSFYTGWREVSSIYKEVFGKDMTPQKVYVLELCDSPEPLTIQDLSLEMNLDASAVSTLISRMEKAALVERTRGLVDRRTVSVCLTAAGKDKLREIRKKQGKLLARVNNGISNQEVEHLKLLIEQITRNRLGEVPV